MTKILYCIKTDKQVVIFIEHKTMITDCDIYLKLNELKPSLCKIRICTQLAIQLVGQVIVVIYDNMRFAHQNLAYKPSSSLIEDM